MKPVLILISIIVLIGCKPKDNDIKKSIAVNAREELQFAGINYSISKGVVTLTGNCPGEEIKNKVVKSIKSAPGVKKVVDHITIGPVVLDNDFVLKQKVDSVLAGYAAVQSNVHQGIVQLNGEILQKDQQKLISDINKLPVNGVVTTLTVK